MEVITCQRQICIKGNHVGLISFFCIFNCVFRVNICNFILLCSNMTSVFLHYTQCVCVCVTVWARCVIISNHINSKLVLSSQWPPQSLQLALIVLLFVDWQTIIISCCPIRKKRGKNYHANYYAFLWLIYIIWMVFHCMYSNPVCI